MEAGIIRCAAKIGKAQIPLRQGSADLPNYKLRSSSETMSDMVGLWEGSSAQQRWTRSQSPSGIPLSVAGLAGLAPC